MSVRGKIITSKAKQIRKTKTTNFSCYTQISMNASNKKKRYKDFFIVSVSIESPSLVTDCGDMAIDCILIDIWNVTKDKETDVNGVNSGALHRGLIELRLKSIDSRNVIENKA